MSTVETSALPRERRTFDRYPCPHAAQTFHGGLWADCAVVDISASGALVESPSRPAIGDTVMLFVEDVAELPGVVVRCQDGAFALAFRMRGRATH